MTTKITENDIELCAIEGLERLRYTYVYGPDISPDRDHKERTSYEHVLLDRRVRQAISRLNPKIPRDSQEDAFKQIHRLNSPDLLTNNEHFHRLLSEGVNVTYVHNGHQRGDFVKLVDFDNPQNNEFLVARLLRMVRTNGLTSSSL